LPRRGRTTASDLAARLDAGLPRPVANPIVLDANGHRLAQPDLLYPRERVAIDDDGSHHGEAREFGQDRETIRLLGLAGYLPLRYDASHSPGTPPPTPDRRPRSHSSSGS
jgi:hypothetical protein